MRSAHSSKWLEAMEDEMRSMSANRAWDFEEMLVKKFKWRVIPPLLKKP
jgi:hypothetical protein